MKSMPKKVTEPKHATEEKVVWSFFSGPMGLDLGLEAAGLGPTMALEIDEWACRTIRANRPKVVVIEDDVRFWTGARLRDHAGSEETDVYLLAGGPPCQSFSPGGNRASVSDPRGNLIYEYLRLIREIQPKYFVFENVANLLTAALSHRPIEERPGKHWNLALYEKHPSMATDDAPAMRPEEMSGSAIRAILEDVARLGYEYVFGVVDAADYGAPQHRLRFAMIGARDGNVPRLPAPTYGPDGSGLLPFRTLRDAIGDLVDDPGPRSEYSDRFFEYFSLVPPGGTWRDLPPAVAREAMGGSYDAGGGKTGFFRRLAWDRPSPTVTGKPNRKGAAMCHPSDTRPLSVKEMMRIQGFPDDWQIAGSMGIQYRQIGDAVPTYLGRALGEALAEDAPRHERQPDPDEMLRSAVARLRGAARNKVGRKPRPNVAALPERGLFDDASMDAA